VYYKTIHYNLVWNGQRRITAFGFRLDVHIGVPVYRQIIDQVLAGVASGGLRAGDQLPTVRQLGGGSGY